jgi:hypothetical protein
MGLWSLWVEPVKHHADVERGATSMGEPATGVSTEMRHQKIGRSEATDVSH